MRDRQRLSLGAEDDLLVGDQAGETQAVDADEPLLSPTSVGQGDLLGPGVCERPLAGGGQPPGRGQGGPRGRVELGVGVGFDDLNRRAG